MKAFAVRLLSALITATLLWLPTVTPAGIVINAID